MILTHAQAKEVDGFALFLLIYLVHRSQRQSTGAVACVRTCASHTRQLRVVPEIDILTHAVLILQYAYLEVLYMLDAISDISTTLICEVIAIPYGGNQVRKTSPRD